MHRSTIHNLLRFTIPAIFIFTCAVINCVNRKHTNPIDPSYEENSHYSLGSLRGVWIIKLHDVVSENNIYVIFNGNGVISDYGSFFMSKPAGTYQVTTDGRLTGVVHDQSSAEIKLYGQMETDTTASLFIVSQPDSIGPIPIIKVSDEGACQGKWTGSFYLGATGYTKYAQLSIDTAGAILFYSGFPNPATGDIYYINNCLVGHFVTGNPVDSSFCEVMIKDGNLTSTQLLGNFNEQCNELTPGNFNLDKVTQFPAIDITGAWNFYFTETDDDPATPQLWNVTQTGDNVVLSFSQDTTFSGSGLVQRTDISCTCSHDGSNVLSLIGTTDGVHVHGVFSDSTASGIWSGYKIVIQE